MHPAASIIIFTTLSGLGYGLAAALGLNLLDPAASATKIAHLLTLALIGAGLLSSTLHLGNPQRAWRALSQWRSSWLSREGVLAIATFVPLLCSAWSSVIDSRYLIIPGLLGAVGAAATVYCTSMIYASLKSIDAWSTPLTSSVYLLFAASGGLLGATFFAFAAGSSGREIIALAAVAATAAAWAVKIKWRRRLRATAPRSDAGSATGLGYLGRVRQFEPPHMTANYLTSEMGYKVARKHGDKLFAIAIGVGGGLPIAFVILAVMAEPSLPLAATLLSLSGLVAHLAGVVVERWLFFAEARHSVMSYYGS